MGHDAFNLCWGLTSVSFPSLLYIPGGAFSDCSALIEAYFPEASSVDIYAFKGCCSLAKLTLHTGADEHFGSCAFDGCAALNLDEITYVGEPIVRDEPTGG
jgi:hypothetical protein